MRNQIQWAAGKLAIGLACIGLSCSANAKHADNLTIPKVEGKIILDANMDETFWQQATKVTLDYETRPGENTPASQKTTAYIAENGEALLIAIVAEDTNPENIQASLKDRDRVWNDDLVGFKVDTFNDERRAYNFFVNPLGIQMDSIEDDVTLNEDGSWNAIWYSEGRITDNGYMVEIELPFKVLRFLDSPGQKTWGIDFVRMHPREYGYRFAYAPVKRDINCYVCQIDKIEGFESIESGSNLEVTPYVSAQKSEQRELPAQPDWQSDGTDSEVGVDVRWGVTDNSVLNATFNPDFSQVEADAAQLDVNTTFSLFFSEKRNFFLDGADYFKSQYNLLHTRNIADPDFGVKYTGKSNGHSFGALVARDTTTTFLLPGPQGSSLAVLDDFESDVAAFRYTYDVGDKSQVGAFITHRSGDGYSNTVASVDGKYHFTDNDVLRFQVMHSESDNPQDVIDEFGVEEESDGIGYRINFVHSERDWSLYATHEEIDEDFRADLGFVGRVGYDKDVLGYERRWYGEEGDFFNQIEVGGDIDQTTDYTGQKLEEEAEMRFGLSGKYQSWIGGGFGVRDVFFQNEDSSGDVDGPWFDQTFWWHSANFSPVTSIRLGYNINGGDAIFYSQAREAERLYYSVWTNWQITRHWFLSADIGKSKLDADLGDVFSSDIINASSTYQFNKESFLRLTLRYTDTDFNQTYGFDNSSQKNVGKQLLYAYKWNPRTVFFLGYSDGMEKYVGNPDPSANDFEEYQGRTIFTKFSYAWQL
ncbi:MAG: carbohydrate binding family 9 domain-containing protein [Kangiellaceae bacterium]|nr:carbohydrate binding family 9 domain-containing protein [Kangiellaceae bacterium]